jgi:phosphoribosylglycinamide formyltransferase 2
MQVADRNYVITMLDGAALRQLVIKEKPAFIVPELEAIATATLLELEQDGFKVIPSARAANLTMNREGIRRLAADELGLATSPFQFADDHHSYLAAVAAIGYPCVVVGERPICVTGTRGFGCCLGLCARRWSCRQRSRHRGRLY